MKESEMYVPPAGILPRLKIVAQTTLPTTFGPFEMLVTGDFISADEAQAKGLVNRVVDVARLDAEVALMVNSILAKPRVAVRLGKQLFYRQLEAGIEAAYADAGQTMACNMMDGSALEGVQAFIDKRPPDWEGA
jgi:enoyl-CoA hydratase/carnithine racemase